MNDFMDKLERSSFGSKEARAARGSVSQDRADQVLRRVAELRGESSRRDEGKRGRRPL